METVETKIVPSKTKSLISINDKLISEIIDRPLKIKNVLFMNFTETISDSNDASSDSNTIQNILNLFRLKTKTISVACLSEPSSFNIKEPRPIKLCFSKEK